MTIAAETAGVSLTCHSCGLSWDVPPKPGGSLPKGARCPVARGGCGTFHAVSRAAGPSRARAAASAAGWQPPGEPRGWSQAGEPCACGERLYVTPRATWRTCGHCQDLVIPPAAAAPYARAGQAPQRQIVSQAERDLAALDLARRKGAMLAQLADLAGDDRLHPESVPVVEWFSAEVKAARTDSRLDELAALLPKAGIRRRHWWQGDPPAIEAPGWDDDGGQDDDGDGQPGGLTAVAPPHAPGAAPGPLTWDDALAAHGWRLAATIGGCQVESHGRLCGAETTRRITGGWVCAAHHGELCQVITGGAR